MTRKATFGAVIFHMLNVTNTATHANRINLGSHAFLKTQNPILMLHVMLNEANKTTIRHMLNVRNNFSKKTDSRQFE